MSTKRRWSPIVGSLVLASVLTASAAQPAAPESRTLPLLQSMAAGHELPPPFTLRALYYWQNHDYDLTDISIASPMLPMLGDLSRALDPRTIKVENDVSQYGGQLEMWLLPFLNLYGLVGYIDGTTDIDFVGNPAAAQLGLNRMSVDYDGMVYGLGATLTYGFGPGFVALNGIVTSTDLDQESSVKAWVLRPIVGVHVGSLAVWTGAMYQKAQEEHEGNVLVPRLGPVAYDIELEESEPWNFVVGAEYSITRNWSVEAELGLGERSQVEASVAWHF